MRALLFYLIIPFAAIGQSKDKLPPLILQGQIKNSPQQEIILFIENVPGEYLLDTIHLEEDGSFYFETNKVTVPQQTSLQKPGIYIDDFFVAPGYNLTLTCDATSPITSNETLKITGKGADSNAFRSTMLYPENDTTFYHLREFSEKKFITYLNTQASAQDSLYQQLYQSKLDKMQIESYPQDPPDPYFSHFAEVVQLNNTFERLNVLLAYIQANKFSEKKAERLLSENFDMQIFNNISNDDWLISDVYQRTVSYYYLQYSKYLDKKNKSLSQNDVSSLEKANQLYDGQVRNYVLVRMMGARIEFSKTLEQLNANREKFTPYIQSIEDTFYQEFLAKEYIKKEAYLLANQQGSPAPIFALPDSIGNIHRLEDFAGKVVYLDFWASWCKPCREETPYLKEIHKTYKEQDDIKFVSIAVRDFPEKWKQAIVKDSVEWLQLFDKVGNVDSAYHANAIPRYIMIDKKGKIADFDAPRPSEATALKELIEVERAK